MNSETWLLRQIHPNFVREGRVTSQAFRPTPKDEGELSVYDGDQIQPQESLEHYQNVLGLKSVGVMGVVQSECTELELTVHSDPGRFKEHVLIDFSSLSKTKVNSASKILRTKAQDRDWLFRDESAQ